MLIIYAARIVFFAFVVEHTLVYILRPEGSVKERKIGRPKYRRPSQPLHFAQQPNELCISRFPMALIAKKRVNSRRSRHTMALISSYHKKVSSKSGDASRRHAQSSATPMPASARRHYASQLVPCYRNTHAIVHRNRGEEERRSIEQNIWRKMRL